MNTIKYLKPTFAITIIFLILTMSGCKDAPTKPPVPPELYLLCWSVDGDEQSMTWEKMQDDLDTQILGEPTSMLLPAGAHGDLLQIYFSDPFFTFPSELGKTWRDSAFTYIGNDPERYISVWTYRIVDKDFPFISYSGDMIESCMKVFGRDSIFHEDGELYGATGEYAEYIFAPEIGLLHYKRNYSSTYWTSGDLESKPVKQPNKRKDGYAWNKDYQPTAVGNIWCYRLCGTSNCIYNNCFRICE